MEKFAVIGSNSFTGAHFVKLLLQRGHQVIGFSRSPEPAMPFRPYASMVKSGNFSFFQFDLNLHLAQLAEKLDEFQPDYVVNFSSQSMVAESWQNPAHWFQTNVVATVNLHEALRKRSYLKSYLHISTPEVYGSCQGAVKEDAPFAPSTPYAVSRAAADLSLMTYFRQYKFPVRFTRAANVYGPGQQLYRIIPKTILSFNREIRLPLHGGGTSRRSFIHVDDVCTGTYQVATVGHDGEVYHIATPELISIRGLVEKIADHMKIDFEKSVEIVGERLGKDSAYWLDTAKIESELKWKPKINLDAGLDETFAWISNYRTELSPLPLEYKHKP